ncbi:MAG: sulfur oxidation c-type cytochrome SoxA [Burkholderiaceae bacterium]
MTRACSVAVALALGLLACACAWAQAPKRSGFDALSPSLQAMQRDDAQNPGMLWVADGELLWRTSAPGAQACSDCHGPVAQSMAGVAARYPDWDAAERRPIDLAQRINACRTRHQRGSAWPAESQELLGLEAYVARASRGRPLAPSRAPELAAARAEGERLYHQRLGQLNLACTQCHDELPGRKLGGTPIPQGHVNGYPLYRLEWQSLGSLRRRIRNCMSGVRAEAFGFDAPEMIALEAYLAQRSAGLMVEAPAVRP